MQKGKKIYFASDVHLGLPGVELPIERERRFIRWLDMAKQDAEEIILLGDIFDFWYEYRKVVPRGFSRFLGKLSEITDSGITVRFFTGNHDIWAFDYLQAECGVILHSEPFVCDFGGKRFFLHHGDGLGNMDWGYKLMKWVFTWRVSQFLFSNLVHPNVALWFGYRWSYRSRYSKGIAEVYCGEKEYIYRFSVEAAARNEYDYMIFGHRHTPVEVDLNGRAKMFILGDWIVSNVYGVFDGESMQLAKFEG
jgi:UDP-2,3-diacylglucosamine hydrolase